MDRNPALVNPTGPPAGAARGEGREELGRPVNSDVTSSDTTRSMFRPRPAGKARAALLALILALPAAGCSLFEAPPVQRGNRADPELLAQLTPGVQTQADVQALLGSPTATGTFDRNMWYYISSVTRMRPASHFSVEDRRVIAMRFDEGGTLRDIREVGQDDMRSVDMVGRTTPVPGTERTVLQALFGNIGRVGAGGLGSETAPGGGPGR